MTNASARPPRFPSVLYDLGRWACTFQMSCLCSGPLGRVAPHLPTLCLADPADSRLACLSPTWLPAVSHLQMLSGCFGLHLLPTCLPTSPSMLWMLWAAWFYTCPPLVSNWAPCVCKSIVGVLGRTINSTLMSPLSPTCLRLSPSMQWVLCTFPGLSPRILWMFCAAWTYACLPLVSPTVSK